MNLKLDCKLFNGDKPCAYNTRCEDCSNYDPIGKRILLIKLASIGDVLRTTPLLIGLKDKYPNSHISWITSLESHSILEGNNFLDRLLLYDLDSILRLQVEKFDVVINLDKAKHAAALTELVKTQEKFGYGLSKEGNIYPINKEAEYGFSLGLFDELKFRTNKKSYQEIAFESVGLEFKNEEYVLNIDKRQEDFRNSFLYKHHLDQDDFKIGLNTGCGSIFPHKKWTMNGFVELVNSLKESCNSKIILLGGKDEKDRNEEILERVGRDVVDAGYGNSLKEFISIISCCDLVVSGDTLSLHIAIALKKKVVALFGPTCAQEIELYGRGIKIVSSKGCTPCYKHKCSKEPICMDLISAKEVFNVIQKLIPSSEFSRKE